MSIGGVFLLLALIRRGAVAGVAALLYWCRPGSALMALACFFGESLAPVQIAGMALRGFRCGAREPRPRLRRDHPGRGHPKRPTKGGWFAAAFALAMIFANKGRRCRACQKRLARKHVRAQ